MSSTDSSSGFDTADIVGIVIGGVLAIGTLIGLIFSFYAMCCRKNKQAQVWAEPNPYYPPNSGYGQPMNTGYYSQQPPLNKQAINNDQPPSYSSVYPGSSPYGKY
jgi:hypothetical protein